MTLKVSIVTVVYNAADTIADALTAVNQQSYDDIEHIVIDGASTDGTQSVIEKFDHIAAFVSEPDAGIYDAMNKGVSMATGDVIGLLNADDFYQHKHVIRDAVAAIKSHDVDACYADLVYVNAIDTDIVVRYWTSQEYSKGLCFTGWMPAHPTLFLRRSVYDRTGLFDTTLDYQADLEFCARIFEKTKVSSVYVPEIWVRMRMGGVTNGSLKTMWRGNWESYHALCKLGLNMNPFRYFLGKFKPKLKQYFTKPTP